MSEKCTILSCELNAYENEDKCILHCEKNEYSEDFHKVGFLNAFYNELIENIVQQVFDKKSEITTILGGTRVQVTPEDFQRDLKSAEEKLSYSKLVEGGQVFVFNQIFFPQSDSRDKFEYTRVLNKLKKIHFNYCEFSISWIELQETECFFQDCIFHSDWHLQNLKVLENVDGVLYQNCTFSDVSSSATEGRFTLEASQFTDCTFENIALHDTIFKRSVFNNSKHTSMSVDAFDIYDCQIEDHMLLYQLYAEHFNIHSTIFKNSFELEKCTIQDFGLLNSKFEGLVDCYNNDFSDFSIYKSTFKEFVGFEYCEFDISRQGLCAKFEYSTFLSFINLRNTTFYGGLDMSNTNLKESPNFLGAEIAADETNKETFRIIKHSFDKVGNISEANKYFSLEMDKERKETSFLDMPQKKIILFLNYHISRFGQNFLLPLTWIFVVMIIHTLTFDWIEKHSITELVPKYAYILELSITELNTLAKNFMPFKRFLQEGMEFISLMFLIIYTTLVYQFIVAVKRVTKR